MPNIIYGRSKEQILADQEELTIWIQEFITKEIPWFKPLGDNLFSIHHAVNNYVYSKKLRNWTDRWPHIQRRWSELTDSIKELM